jgi:hypothetical protein
VNLGSTMALDFAIHGKPAIFLAYDPAGTEPWVDQVYRLPHLRCVNELQPVYWARSPEGLGEAVRHALAHPEEKAAARAAWLHRIVALPLDRASERCAAALLELAR